MANPEGVWRTIGGRRIFIKTGQRVSEAMKESGKFKKSNNKLHGPDSKEVQEINDKITKEWGSSELEDTRMALASAERYLEKHPDNEMMKRRVELHKKNIERLEKQESSKKGKSSNTEAMNYMQDQFKAFDKGNISGADLEKAKKDSGLSKEEIEKARNYVNDRAPESYAKATENKSGNTTSQAVPNKNPEYQRASNGGYEVQVGKEKYYYNTLEELKEDWGTAKEVEQVKSQREKALKNNREFSDYGNKEKSKDYLSQEEWGARKRAKAELDRDTEYAKKQYEENGDKKLYDQRMETINKAKEDLKGTKQSSKNIVEEVNESNREYAKKKAEEYRNTKDPMFQDIKEERARAYEKQASYKASDLEEGKPYEIDMGNGIKKTAIYMGKDSDGNSAFYDGEGVNGTFAFSDKFVNEKLTVSDNKDDDKFMDLHNQLRNRDSNREHKTKINSAMDVPTRIRENSDIAEQIIIDDEWNDIHTSYYGGNNAEIVNERTGKRVKITPYDNKETLSKKIEDSYKENKTSSNDWVRDAFNQYKKDHPNTKMTIADFKKNNLK